jgi:hypothetical protein
MTLLFLLQAYFKILPVFENRSFLAFVPEIEILSLSALVKLNILVTIA